MCANRVQLACLCQFTLIHPLKCTNVSAAPRCLARRARRKSTTRCTRRNLSVHFAAKAFSPLAVLSSTKQMKATHICVMIVARFSQAEYSSRNTRPRTQPTGHLHATSVENHFALQQIFARTREQCTPRRRNTSVLNVEKRLPAGTK